MTEQENLEQTIGEFWEEMKAVGEEVGAVVRDVTDCAKNYFIDQVWDYKGDPEKATLHLSKAVAGTVVSGVAAVKAAALGKVAATALIIGGVTYALTKFYQALEDDTVGLYRQLDRFDRFNF